ncbi:MAG: ribosome small subunit-dependent GTPase A [Haliangiales bacterium]
MQLSPLSQLGWCQFFAAQPLHTEPTPAPSVPARVVVEYQDRYHLQGADGLLWAQLSGALLRDSRRDRLQRPAVGDWVAVQPAAGDGMGTISGCYQRRSCFVRQAAGRRPGLQVVAANVDTVFVVTEFGPDFSPRRIERYLTTVHESGARAVLVLNKLDLATDPERVLDEARALAAGVPVLAVSAACGRGLDSLREHLAPTQTAALVGSSGVGKSTLINWLSASERQKTAPVREHDGRGRHTTTHRELIVLPGEAILIDTPGMRALQLWTADDGLRTTFQDIEALAEACRFRDCGHGREPGCAVRRAVERKRLAPERLASYHSLRREIADLPAHRRSEAIARVRAASNQLRRARSRR